MSLSDSHTIMKKPLLDSNGIPVLSREDIELLTEQFIRFFDEDCLKQPSLTPLAKICTTLQKEHNVTFIFNKDLGGTKEGYKYRGSFHIPSTTIYVDKNMEYGEPRFNFTLAHEIGHFVLHRKIDLSILKDKEKIKDTNRDLILDHIQSDNPRTWLEWQANKFASSLLLPRPTVLTAVLNKQKEMGINRNPGKIFVDRGVSSNIDYDSQIENIALIYQSSRASIRIRLQELDILYETTQSPTREQNEPAHLGRFLSNIIDNFDNNG